MTEAELLMFARGPGLTIATFVMVAGIVVRLVEILMLGRKANLAEARGSENGGRPGYRVSPLGARSEHVSPQRLHRGCRLRVSHRPVRRDLPVRAAYSRVPVGARTELAGPAVEPGRRGHGTDDHRAAGGPGASAGAPGHAPAVGVRRLSRLVRDHPAAGDRLSRIPSHRRLRDAADRTAHPECRAADGPVSVHQARARVYALARALVQRRHCGFPGVKS